MYNRGSMLNYIDAKWLQFKTVHSVMSFYHCCVIIRFGFLLTPYAFSVSDLQKIFFQASLSIYRVLNLDR